jgi:hypothetical protein
MLARFHIVHGRSSRSSTAGHPSRRLGDYSQALARFYGHHLSLRYSQCLGFFRPQRGKVEVEAEPGYVEPVNIYVCPVLESGNRKTAVVQHATKVLGNYENGERERLASQIARLESERKAKEVVIDKLCKKLKDAEAADIRHIAELDVIAGRYNTTPNLDVWLKAHCQSHVRVHCMGRAILVDKPHDRSDSSDAVIGTAIPMEVSSNALLRTALFLQKTSQDAAAHKRLIAPKVE